MAICFEKLFIPFSSSYLFLLLSMPCRCTIHDLHFDHCDLIKKKELCVEICTEMHICLFKKKWFAYVVRADLFVDFKFPLTLQRLHRDD